MNPCVNFVITFYLDYINSGLDSFFKHINYHRQLYLLYKLIVSRSCLYFFNLLITVYNLNNNSISINEEITFIILLYR